MLSFHINSYSYNKKYTELIIQLQSPLEVLTMKSNTIQIISLKIFTNDLLFIKQISRKFSCDSEKFILRENK